MDNSYRARSPLREQMYLDSPRLPLNASVGVGERLEITCYISGYPIPQVFWFKDGIQLNEHNPDNDFSVSLIFKLFFGIIFKLYFESILKIFDFQ